MCITVGYIDVYHISQQPAVLAELYAHANPDDLVNPADQDSVMATYAYLQAVHKMFEMGFLNSLPHDQSKIRDLQSPILQSIREGFDYFKNWCDDLHVHCKAHFLCNTKTLQMIHNYQIKKQTRFFMSSFNR